MGFLSNNLSFQMWCWRRALWIPWTAKKKNKWVVDQIKSELSVEAKMRLLYFGHIKRRQESHVLEDILEDVNSLGHPKSEAT